MCAVGARRFVCLTNIPTPYRVFQFRLVHAELERRGWAFEVWFMAKSEPRRNWTFDASEFDFPHRFLRGFRFEIVSDSFHINPEVLTCLRHVRPEILLVAGGWALPTVWLASLALVPRKIFWSESHLCLDEEERICRSTGTQVFSATQVGSSVARACIV